MKLDFISTKKYWGSALLIVLFIILVGIFALFIYNKITTVRVNGIVINNVNNAADQLSELYSKTSPVLKDSELNKHIKYTYDFKKVENRSFFRKLMDGVLGTNYNVDFYYEVDTDSLINDLNKYNETALKSEDAKIEFKDGTYIVVDEIYGNEIDTENLVASLDGKTTGIKVDAYYITPVILSSDLKDLANLANSYLTWSCGYTSGDIITVPSDSVKIEDNEIKLETSWLSEALKPISKAYNTVGSSRDFLTTAGNWLSISGGTWGSEINFDKELEFITEAFNSCNNLVNRTPEFAYSREDIGNTYVELDVVNQHLWVYIDGILSMETDVVTGTSGKNDTPKGIYFISERVNGKYLRGDGYKTWVDKWMRITWRGHGLHDASWRSSFGGSIYTYNGSHGCINLPKQFAYNLYDITYTGMPVIIY